MASGAREVKASKARHGSGGPTRERWTAPAVAILKDSVSWQNYRIPKLPKPAPRQASLVSLARGQHLFTGPREALQEPGVEASVSCRALSCGSLKLQLSPTHGVWVFASGPVLSFCVWRHCLPAQSKLFVCCGRLCSTKCRDGTAAPIAPLCT